MSTWRRKAIDLFPDLRGEFAEKEATIYTVFFSLLPRVRDAHLRGDEEELRRIYDFAAWCARQPATDLWNAAGVAFYEHLPDDPATLRDFPRWVGGDIFEDVRSLLEGRMDPDQFKRLAARYRQR